ncbi:hypothetical protein [Flavobacterium sp.]|jgi:hypothetical protein|uniref:hypothetical protein n=1 Tax=Flavobacterium sp. TaxID=239 RepID=UPI0037C05DBC
MKLLDFDLDEGDLENIDFSNITESNSTTPPRTVTIIVDCRYFSAHYGYAYGFGHDAQGNTYYWWKNSKGTFCKKVERAWCY